MKMGVIMTLPRHDEATEYLAQFSVHIEDEAQRKNIAVKKLKDKDANRKEFEKAVEKLDYKMVVFNGHGSDESVYGYDDEVIVEVGANDHLLNKKITYARVCDAASILGRSCTKMGDESCFIGYELPFMFYSDRRWSSTPLKDETAKLFFEPSNLVPISLLKGNTASEANEHSKKAILKNINKVLRTNDKESFLLAEALWNNFVGQVVVGDGSATL